MGFMGSGTQDTLLTTPLLLLICCVTLDKCLSLSGPVKYYALSIPHCIILPVSFFCSNSWMKLQQRVSQFRLHCSLYPSKAS